MEKSLIPAWILVLTTAIALAPSLCYYNDDRPYVPPPQKQTYLHFFLHDTFSGDYPSAVFVADPNTTTAFGQVTAVDDPLTIGPNITSEVIGNARGLWVLSAQDAATLMVYMDFEFTLGEFNGSSISVFSRNPIIELERELAVVGGREKFRMAQGFARLKTYFANFRNGDVIVEYNVTVIHY
ncbi:dirigent protein 4-like [Hibiscus syriacus]|nr:dirigent protein 4-like [Hibiscus syriacus]